MTESSENPLTVESPAPSQFPTTPESATASERRVTSGQAVATLQSDPRHLLMKHPDTGVEVVAPIGFSIPVLLLGPLPLFWRRNWHLAANTTLMCLLLPVIGQVWAAKVVNRKHLVGLVNQGYRAVSTERGRVTRAEWLIGLRLPRYSPTEHHHSTA